MQCDSKVVKHKINVLYHLKTWKHQEVQIEIIQIQYRGPRKNNNISVLRNVLDSILGVLKLLDRYLGVSKQNSGMDPLY